MGIYLVRRLLLTVPLLWGIATVSFLLVHLAPGGPAILIPREIFGHIVDTARLKQSLGLNQPLPGQYLRWLGRLAQGDFGNSFTDGAPVTSDIADRLPATLELVGTAICLALAIGVPAGIVAATHRDRIVDRLLGLGAILTYSIPLFWLALIGILVFAVQLHWLPFGGRTSLTGPPSPGDALQHLILPAGVLSLAYLGTFTLFMRSGMLDVLREDFIRTARAKGLSRRQVLLKHAVRNALIPLITIVGLSLPDLFAGSVVIENTFGWPGIGQLIVSSAGARDYPIVLGTTVIVGVLVILGNLLADLAYAALDPRIRLG